MSLPGCIRNVTVNHVDIGKPAALFKMQDCYRNSPESGVSFGNGGGTPEKLVSDLQGHD